MQNGDQFKDQMPTLLARTERWLVMAKPAGWLTIPGRPGTGQGSESIPVLSQWVTEHFDKVWVVHRLDRETSGLVLFALSAEAHRQANEWFSKHLVRKTYDFLAAGQLRAPVVRVKAPIEGSPSVTQAEIRENFGNCFLGKAQPLTGRRHQIRIHLAGEGCPLLGDIQYGGARDLAGRVALHAARLELPSKEVFEASWPADFSGWVAQLRARSQT